MPCGVKMPAGSSQIAARDMLAHNHDCIGIQHLLVTGVVGLGHDCLLIVY